jgi:hypothetical protein
MFLEMHLGPLLIEKKFIDFSTCETIAEREELLHNTVEKMYSKNIMKVTQSREEPVFYLDKIPSTMSELKAVKQELNL